MSAECHLIFWPTRLFVWWVKVHNGRWKEEVAGDKRARGAGSGLGVKWKPAAQLHDRLCLLFQQVLRKDKNTAYQWTHNQHRWANRKSSAVHVTRCVGGGDLGPSRTSWLHHEGSWRINVSWTRFMASINRSQIKLPLGLISTVAIILWGSWQHWIVIYLQRVVADYFFAGHQAIFKRYRQMPSVPLLNNGAVLVAKTWCPFNHRYEGQNCFHCTSSESSWNSILPFCVWLVSRGSSIPSAALSSTCCCSTEYLWTKNLWGTFQTLSSRLLSSGKPTRRKVKEKYWLEK